MSAECLEWIIGMIITVLAVVCLASDPAEKTPSASSTTHHVTPVSHFVAAD